VNRVASDIKLLEDMRSYQGLTGIAKKVRDSDKEHRSTTCNTLYSNYDKFHVFIRVLRNVFYVVDCMKRNSVKSLPVKNINS